MLFVIAHIGFRLRRGVFWILKREGVEPGHLFSLRRILKTAWPLRQRARRLARARTDPEMDTGSPPPGYSGRWPSLPSARADGELDKSMPALNEDAFCGRENFPLNRQSIDGPARQMDGRVEGWMNRRSPWTGMPDVVGR
jgi:hypothetical protein